jgi:hypothetical protein
MDKLKLGFWILALFMLITPNSLAIVAYKMDFNNWTGNNEDGWVGNANSNVKLISDATRCYEGNKCGYIESLVDDSLPYIDFSADVPDGEFQITFMININLSIGATYLINTRCGATKQCFIGLSANGSLYNHITEVSHTKYVADNLWHKVLLNCTDNSGNLKISVDSENAVAFTCTNVAGTHDIRVDGTPKLFLDNVAVCNDILSNDCYADAFPPPPPPAANSTIIFSNPTINSTFVKVGDIVNMAMLINSSDNVTYGFFWNGTFGRMQNLSGDIHPQNQSCTGGFIASCNNFNDTDWGTYANIMIGFSGYIYQNYYIPLYSNNISFKVQASVSNGGGSMQGYFSSNTSTWTSFLSVVNTPAVTNYTTWINKSLLPVYNSTHYVFRLRLYGLSGTATNEFYEGIVQTDYGFILSPGANVSTTAQVLQQGRVCFGAWASSSSAYNVSDNYCFYAYNLNMSNAYPAQNNQFNSNTISINSTVNSVYAFDCFLYLNGTLNASSLGHPSTDTVINFSVPFIQKQAYFNYSISCNTSYVAFALGHGFYVDDIAPSLYTNLQGNASNFTLNILLVVNASDPFLNTLMVNGTSFNYSNVTTAYQEIYFNKSINISDVGLGDQILNFMVCDSPNGTDVLNCIYPSYEYLSLARYRINAARIEDNTAVTTFDIYINGTYSGSTVTGTYDVSGLTQGSYLFEIRPDGYQVKNTTLKVNATFQNYTFSLYIMNSVSITIKDEITKAIINDRNVSLDFISSVFSLNTSTENGTYYIDLLSPTMYQLRYSAPGYTERFYFFNLLNRSHTDISLYLLVNTSASAVTAYVVDQTNRNIEDAYIKALRYNIVINDYEIIEIAKTNFEGMTQLSLILNSEYYKFIIEYMGVVYLVTTPTYIYSTTLSPFQITLGTETGQVFFITQGISNDITFNNATKNFRYTFSDPSNIISQGCGYLYKKGIYGEKILYNSSCADGSSGSLLLPVDPINGTSYTIDGYVNYGATEVYMGSSEVTFDTTNQGGNLGVIMVIFLMLLFALFARWSKSLALILFPIPLIMGAYIHLIDLPLWITFALEIVFCIIAWIVSRLPQY